MRADTAGPFVKARKTPAAIPSVQAHHMTYLLDRKTELQN